jgi:hypothetical protein
LKSSEIGPWGGGDWIKDDFQMVAIHPPSFRIFGQVEIGFWVKLLISNYGAKIKVIEMRKQACWFHAHSPQGQAIACNNTTLSCIHTTKSFLKVQSHLPRSLMFASI